MFNENLERYKIQLEDQDRSLTRRINGLGYSVEDAASHTMRVLLAQQAEISERIEVIEDLQILSDEQQARYLTVLREVALIGEGDNHV